MPCQSLPELERTSLLNAAAWYRRSSRPWHVCLFTRCGNHCGPIDECRVIRVRCPLGFKTLYRRSRLIHGLVNFPSAEGHALRTYTLRFIAVEVGASVTLRGTARQFVASLGEIAEKGRRTLRRRLMNGKEWNGRNLAKQLGQADPKGPKAK